MTPSSITPIRTLRGSNCTSPLRQSGPVDRTSYFTLAFPSSTSHRRTTRHTMGKKTGRGEYNDFVDGEKLQDNAEVRTSLQKGRPDALPRDVCPSPSATRQDHKRGEQKMQLTHFLCLPLVNEWSRPQLEQGLERLRREFGKDDPPLLPPKAVRPVGTLHLTLGVMSLDEERLGKATQLLQDMDLGDLLQTTAALKVAEKAAENGLVAENLNAAAFPETGPLLIRLRGLVPMHSPQNTSMLYAEPDDESGRLYPFSVGLKKLFMGKGLMIQEDRALRLHATIINTIYVKSGGRHGPNAKSLLKFDARELVQQWQDFSWANDLHVDRVQICKMGAKKILNERGDIAAEEYEVVSERRIRD